MSSTASTVVPSGAAPETAKKRPRPGLPKLRTEGVSAEARRQAAAILEVLAGVRTPSEVAQQLVASGWDGEEAVKTAVHEAATMVAGGTSYGGRRASTQDLLRVAHARNQADRAVDRIGAVQATPLVQATPGTRLSTEDLVAKWGRV